MKQFDLNRDNLKRINRLIPRYPTKRSCTLPLLHIIQEEQGYLSKPAIEWVAKKLDLPAIQVLEVVTFYPMFRQNPIGKRHVKVCRTLSCALHGSHETCRILQKELNCDLNQTSSDGNFTLEFVECIASCGTAPVVHIDETMHHQISPEKAKGLAQRLKKEQGIF